MGGVTYDSGALISAERTGRLVWALHRRSLERGSRPTVPAGVLAQAWRGGPQADLSRFLRGCRIEALDESRARTAGAACAAAGTSDPIDATVVVGALARGDVVVTSDDRDIRHLAESLGASIEIVHI